MRLRGLPGLLILAMVLLFVVPSAVAFYTDWLWFQELGYQRIFLRSLNAQGTAFAVTFLAVFLFLHVNLRFARRRTFDRPRVVLGTGADGRTISVESRRLANLAVPLSLAVAFGVGMMGAAMWMSWLTFFNAVPFGDTDPLFGREISFYVYRLPVYQAVRHQALLVSVVALIGCGLYYVLSGSFVVEARPGVPWPRVRLVQAARRHLSLLVTLILGLLAWGAWLEVPNTLLTPTPASVAFGASYADVYARIPFLWLTMATLVLSAVLAAWHGFGRRSWMLPLAVALYFAVSLGGGLYASFVQRFVVTPDEQNKEQPYIVHNIAATRKAYGLDRVVERELSGDAELTATDIIDNAGTIENVRLWDHDVLLQTFGQLQEIRTYYDFLQVDNDRYRIGGKSRQVMLSARELNTGSMQNRSWVNERLTFTHGYGITLGPVNQVTTEGLPVLFIRDLPPVSTVDLRVDQPSIYYGELQNTYALVKTNTAEFHYPRGDDNVTTTYDGTGGVPIGSLWRRLLFAIRFTSTDILVSPMLTSESRIMFHRQIRERVERLAPFLMLDFDPYLVVSEGRLFWMQDAYTTTANYPYSTPRSSATQPSLNYIRNSVKIVIDAYNGDVTFYLADPADPIVRTLANVFPSLLRPLAEMSADLRSHIRYPEQLFRTQSAIYTTYHMTNPLVFYNKEDQWDVPALDSGQATSTPSAAAAAAAGGGSAAMVPYYTMMRLPGEEETEFIQMLPFTPRAKANLAAWMVARSDADYYGQLVVFQFPKNQIVYGPRQIVGRINQDQVISPQITLWSQQGSRVIWGTLLVIPVNESLIYVRPLYLLSPEGRIPELKRVVVAYKDRIVMRETLTLGLVDIFGTKIMSALEPDRLQGSGTTLPLTPAPGGVSTPPPAAPGARDPVIEALISQIQGHYDRMIAAQKAGDWATYGEEQKALGAALARLTAAERRN
jgi:uncharacterized membrane protein (UPF0182 family)